MAAEQLGGQRDLTQREGWWAGERLILEAIASGAPLTDTLLAITRLVEQASPGVLASILLVDEQGRLHIGAAPSLPQWYNDAIDGEPIGPHAGTCGTAAFRKAVVTSPDIAQDPLWEDYRDLALRAGLAAGWSTPLLDPAGIVLGTLAHYYATPMDPTPHDLHLTDVARHLAEIAIQRSLADEALKLANADLQVRIAERSAQVEAATELDRLKNLFVNSISHDLRTPLTAILGYLELLEDGFGGPLSDQQSEYLRAVDTSTRRLQRLVDDLLEYARLEAGSFALRCLPTDLARVVQEVLDSLRPQADDARVRLTLASPPEPVLTLLDPQRIEQVVANLVTNAIKFSPADGEVQLRIERHGDWLRCAIIDQGPGIAAADLPRLFQLFSQLDAGARKGGTGLGLVIAKNLVESHGGTIGVNSEPGSGSTFWFELPMPPPAA